MSDLGVRAIFPLPWTCSRRGVTEHSAMVRGNTPPLLCLGIQRWVHWLVSLGAGGAAPWKWAGATKRGVWVQLSQNDGSMQQDMRPWGILVSPQLKDRQEHSPSRVLGKTRGNIEKALT